VKENILLVFHCVTLQYQHRREISLSIRQWKTSSLLKRLICAYKIEKCRDNYIQTCPCSHLY